MAKFSAGKAKQVTKEVQERAAEELRQRSEMRLNEIYALIESAAASGKNRITVPAANKYDWGYIFKELRMPDESLNSFGVEFNEYQTHVHVTW